MSYLARTFVEFCGSPTQVYDALCQLGRYPEWNLDMIAVSYTGMMHEGLKYVTESHVAGRTNISDVEVVRMTPDREIYLRSQTGIISFEVVYLTESRPNGGTNVRCSIEFSFHNFVMDLARPIIELMARDRVEQDLEKLARLLCQETNHAEAS